jgi:hypothetical protein
MSYQRFELGASQIKEILKALIIGRVHFQVPTKTELFPVTGVRFDVDTYKTLQLIKIIMAHTHYFANYADHREGNTGLTHLTCC